uniref:Negative regulator of ubiquitin-like proteins 1 n=1 Tax=Cyprinus carpio carpio TaxID=630221 RepID=A0A8C1FSK3_CYPCA
MINAGFPGDFHSRADGFRFRFQTLCASEDLWRSVEMEEKLISLLRRDKVQLCTEPFISDQQKIRELAQKYASASGFSLEEVISTLESIRAEKDEGNKQFKETAVASLELLLPKREGENKKMKAHLKTKLDITTKELMKQISEEHGFKHFKLILAGKTLSPEKRLDEQNVKTKSKIMVMVVAPEQEKKQMLEEEEKKHQLDEGLQRTQKGFQILSERDGSEDPGSTPYLEIADQKGNPLQIPDSERKALILAMGFHEKGRALIKKRNYSAALTHLWQADEQFNKCNPALQRTVDNYAVLQLDVVWCYQALKQLEYLKDARQRLERAEDCFKRCYGEQKSRLQQIKGHTGGEDVLFLRLYLLQSLLADLEGEKDQAVNKLKKVNELFRQLSLDTKKMDQLVTLGFSEQEARLGLRACRGDVEEAKRLIEQRKKEKEELKEREQEMRRSRLQDINTLVELGFSKRDAARALHQTRGDLDEAYRVRTHTHTHDLLDRAEAQRSERVAPPSPPSSSDSTAWSRVDEDLVKEVLEDIPRHEEDYLDLSLDEEKELMQQIRSRLETQSSSSA